MTESPKIAKFTLISVEGAGLNLWAGLFAAVVENMEMTVLDMYNRPG
jgi:hypothetical protein